ncbi:MAG TPA: glutamine-hydrolyzing carbamoyl-phosphate synthase small subunit [Candidatus Binatia bacterium]|jgi:carbamoyl-phosphate synthase small subunit|nr:glutamine-hydrolyzing carbamoyl-phosphate synthase small subunit [Candidatus Binatia bacterium]
MAGKDAILALADGTVFRGRAFGAVGEASGELVFNTSMTGYQEILTDPSYEGQLVAMTYPEIGNTGVNREDVESRRPFVRGFIVREYRDMPSSWRAEQSLGAYLAEHGIPGIEGIDTRALVRHLRDNGSQEAVLSSVDLDPERLVRKAKDAPSMVGQDLVTKVTAAEPYGWDQGPWKPGGYLMAEEIAAALGRPTLKVVAYDYGIKYNILRNLVGVGCAVRVVPASTPAADVLKLNPDGVFLSNGPGDPDAVVGARENVAALLGKVPVFGICLGHQILGLALGGSTYKLKFGHHGGNQPVQDLTTGKVEITSQNHGFAVDMDSLKDKADVTHLNLNDRTVEGLSVRGQPTFSVQYHPEASPGPHDARYLFRRFVDLMERDKGN